MKKRGALDYVLLMSIVALIVLLVLLRLDNFILNLFKGAGEDFGCVFSASLRNLEREASKQTTEFTPLKCERESVTIVLTQKEKKELEEKNKDEAYYPLDRPLPTDRKKQVLNWYQQQSALAKKKGIPNAEYLYPPVSPDFFDGDETKKHLYEYRMNEAIANEMKSCWNKMGRGELNLFNDVSVKVNNPFETKDLAVNLVFTVLAKKYLKLGLLSSLTLGTAAQFLSDSKLTFRKNTCIVCSRIIFNSDVHSQFGDDDITSLARWAQVHPIKAVREDAISYYQFMLDDSIPPDFFEGSQDERYSYSTNYPYAVIYRQVGVRGPLEQIKKFFKKFDTKSGDADATINLVQLIKYEELYDTCEVEN